MTNKKRQDTANSYASVLKRMELGNQLIHLSVLGHVLSIRGLKTYLPLPTHQTLMIPTLTTTSVQKAIPHSENRKLKFKTIKVAKTIMNQQISLQDTGTINIFQV